MMLLTHPLKLDSVVNKEERKMKCKTIAIDGVEYRPVGEEPARAGEAMRIVIADNRGLTFVGRFSLDGTDEFVTIYGARCVIRWGTTKHLAQLADGPTSNTLLGAERTVRVPRRNIVAVYECGDAWNSK